jgi:hypothetical protein
LFCGSDLCEPVRNGLVVYTDDNHLTATYARSIAPAIGERLAGLVPPKALESPPASTELID